MKLYILRNNLFNYIAITIASNSKDAKKYFKKNITISKDDEWVELDIKEGLFFEGGGNG